MLFRSTQGLIDALKERVRGSKVYISVDIDVLDPAYAPATGTAEVGGWTTRELLTILDGLMGLEVVGADVGEWRSLLVYITCRANSSLQLRSRRYMTILAKLPC